MAIAFSTQVGVFFVLLAGSPIFFQEVVGSVGSDVGTQNGNCSTNSDGECPLGYYQAEGLHSAGASCSCRAGNSSEEVPGIVNCNFAKCTSFLAPGYWLGYEDTTNITTSRILTGICPPYYCHPGKVPLSYQNSTELDELSCGTQNRRGVLCGQCKEGYGLSVISLTWFCIPCERNFSWPVVGAWFVATFIPFNLLLILFIVSRVNISSGLLCSFVVFCQVLPATEPYVQSDLLPKPLAILTKIILFISNTFNLHVFESVIPPFPNTCLSSSMTALDHLIGRYFIALVYPLLLFGLFVFVQSLYRRGIFCRPIHVLLTKLGRCVERCHAHRDQRGSILTGLCSFFVLQYTQLAHLTLLVLAPSFLFHSKTSVKRPVLWFDGNINYFSLQHLPYAFPIMICSTVYLLVPPLLLLAYPALPQLLVRCNLSSKRPFSCIVKALTRGSCVVYFDVFQGPYKPHFRFFAGLFFIFRILFLIPHAFGSNDTDMFTFGIFITLIFALITTVCQPYEYRGGDKSNTKTGVCWQNRIDVLIFGNLALISLFKYYFYMQNFTSPSLQLAVATLSVILMYLPLVGFTLYFILSLWRRYSQRVKRLVGGGRTQESNPPAACHDAVNSTETSVTTEPLLPSERVWEKGTGLQLDNSVLYIDA